MSGSKKLQNLRCLVCGGPHQATFYKIYCSEKCRQLGMVPKEPIWGTVKISCRFCQDMFFPFYANYTRVCNKRECKLQLKREYDRANQLEVPLCGHPASDTYVSNDGRRKCRTCNNARKLAHPKPPKVPTHCRKGHPISDSYVKPNGYRTCRTCLKSKRRKRRLRQADLSCRPQSGIITYE